MDTTDILTRPGVTDKCLRPALVLDLRSLPGDLRVQRTGSSPLLDPFRARNGMSVPLQSFLACVGVHSAHGRTSALRPIERIEPCSIGSPRLATVHYTGSQCSPVFWYFSSLHTNSICSQLNCPSYKI